MNTRQGDLGTALPPPTFGILVSNLAAQAMIELGEIKNPMTNAVSQSLPRAKFTIDLLGILRDKTRGNLTSEEDRFFEDTLYGLKMRYVKRVS